MKENNRLTKGIMGLSEVGKPTPPGAPDHSFNLLKSKTEKGGELEGMT
jgi:hypothetical protein